MGCLEVTDMDTSPEPCPIGRVSLSVVIPCYEEAQFIRGALDALRASAGSRADIEIIVVDGGSTDGTPNLVWPLAAADPRIRLICHTRRHTSVSLNLGIREARGDSVAILGAHAMVDPDWIDAVERTLARHPDACGVGGVLNTTAPGRSGEAISVAQSTPIGVGNSRFRIGGQPGYVDTVVFGAYRRELFQQVGGFDEELIRNQDDEFNIRVTARGGRLFFDPEIRCRYYARSSFARLWKQYYQYGFWKVRVRQKVGRLGSWRQYVPAAFVAGAALCFPAAAAVAGGRVFLCAYLALYLAAVTGGSLVALRGQLRLLPLVSLAVIIMHTAYGLGFWEGIARWMALGSSKGDYHRALTR